MEGAGNLMAVASRADCSQLHMRIARIAVGDAEPFAEEQLFRRIPATSFASAARKPDKPDRAVGSTLISPKYYLLFEAFLHMLTYYMLE